ncbi:MAG: Gldg family protein [Candidatus Acidiferrales bacterium]|jgi:ABC-type uncharacterized transport system involved in gliding motility auxiliary subunit
MKQQRLGWAEFAGTIGVACLISGYVRYTIQNEWTHTSEALLIAGGVLVLASVVLGFRGILAFFSKRSSRLGTNTGVLALAVLAILVILNFLGFRHHKRFDLTSEKLFTLSDQTRKIVSGLQQDVTIVRFAKTPDTQLDDLMAEYRNLSSHIKFQNVDPQEKPDVAKNYGATRMGDVILALGSRKQNLEPEAEGGFTEENITGALLKVTRDKTKMVCFVTGHGEKSLTDDSAQGYTVVDQQLKKETYATNTVNLASAGSVSSDCDVLVIAGPTQAFFPQEAAMVGKYLDGGGKVLIEIDPETDPKLNDIFQAWNVNVGKNVVIDASGAGRLFGTGPTFPIVLQYGDSPITKNLARTMTLFPMARTVSVADKQKFDPETVELLKTSQASFTIPGLEKGQKEVSFNPKTGTAGPLSLGVAADRKSGDRESRLVVIGNSAFAANPWFGAQSDGDLFLNTIDWLAQDENLISIRPKTATNRRITLTQGQAAGLDWFELFLLPGFVIIMGISIWWKRR